MDRPNSQTNLNRGEPSHPAPPRPYRKTNAYTQSPSPEQVLTMLMFLAITFLHGAFVTSGAFSLGSSILWTLVGFTYALLMLIGVDYCYLTCSDPADDLLKQVSKNYRESELSFCHDCVSKVHNRSHHCKRCKRCVEHFDHHCKYLNNCIGGKNYHRFFRMLIAVTVYCLAIIGEALWVFLAAHNDPALSVVSKWGAVATLALAVVALVAVDSLLCFHFYLVFWLKSTTLDYIMNRPDSEEGNPA